MGYAWDTGDAALFFGALRECCCVRLDGCWEWGGSRNGGGYALWRGTLLHRRVVEMRENARLGTQPVHHRCGHTWCVCPDHVEPVTVAENTAEMLARRAFVTRIDELTAALREVDPENEALSRVRYGVDSDRVGE